MKIINAKVYTIEEITQEDLNNLALERNTLVQENEELKSQLRGTTHCFDDEEHNRLKEEITNLSKDVDMWNAKYNDMFDENKELKKQLENCYCNRMDCSGRIKDSKVYDSLVQKVETQQKEFIDWLEDEIKKQKEDIFANSFIDLYIKRIKILKIEEILNKYKEIIGVSDENNKQ